MKLFTYRGKRIRASDKNLLVNFAVPRLVVIFVIVMFLFYRDRIRDFNWADFSLLNLDGGSWLSGFDVRHLILSVAVSLIVCGVGAVLYCALRKDSIKQMRQRQAVARMIIENNWYESATAASTGFFKDFGSTGSKEKITQFPAVFYRIKGNRIHISVKITMGRFQEQLMKLEKKIESGLFCELVDKVANDPYLDYEFFYDLAKTRISIDEVNVKNGRMELMKFFYWSFDSLPNMLISGGIGSGKSYFILTLIKALLDAKAKIYVLDPKCADLADLATVMPDVYYKSDDIINCIDRFCDGLLARNESMKTMPNYRTGGNYASLGLEPHFLIFDEFVAFLEMLDKKKIDNVMSRLKQIVMLGRQSGYFIILACQRPDAKYLADGIRDQFSFRVALGRNSELGYKMMFGDVDRVFTTSQVKGRGYADSGKGVVSEFYSPSVPKGYDFLGEIKKAVRSDVIAESWEGTTPDMLDGLKEGNN